MGCFSFVIEKEDTAADEKKRQQKDRPGHKAFLLQKKRGEKHAHDRGGEGEDRYLGYGIELEEHAPQRIRDRRKKRKIKHHEHAFYGGKSDVSARNEANGRHDRTAENELIAREDDGILVLGKALHQHGGDRKRYSGEENEGVTEQIHPEGQAVDVHEDDAREAKQTSHDLFKIQLFHAEDQAGNENGEEGRGAREDRALHAGGVCESDVEEDVLNYGLERRNGKDARKV